MNPVCMCMCMLYTLEGVTVNTSNVICPSQSAKESILWYAGSHDTVHTVIWPAVIMTTADLYAHQCYFQYGVGLSADQVFVFQEKLTMYFNSMLIDLDRQVNELSKNNRSNNVVVAFMISL